MKIQLVKLSLACFFILFFNGPLSAHQDDHTNVITINDLITKANNDKLEIQQSLENTEGTSVNTDHFEQKNDYQQDTDSSEINQVNDGIMLEQHSLSESGVTHQYAIFNILDIFTGKAIKITLEKNKPKNLQNDLTINLEACWKETDEKYSPINKALIKIYKTEENKEEPIYNGWAFSNITSISFPKYDNYYFYLISCHD